MKKILVVFSIAGLFAVGTVAGANLTPEENTSQFADNHGQYVRSQENKREAAQSFVGMLAQIKGKAFYFETLEKSWNAGDKFIERENYIVENEEDWGNLWDLVFSNIISKPDLPFIDFEKESVVAVFQGQKGSKGYSIEIGDVRKVKNSIVVSVTESEPGSSCITASVISRPFHIIKIPIAGLSDYNVDFRNETRVNECM